jgi:protein TonB
MTTPPQTGDIIADHRERFAMLRGAALVARREQAFESTAADLSNVVPFAPPRREPARKAPELTIAPEQRAAPPPAPSLGRQVAVLAGSLALHGIVFAAFFQQPKPLASIGIEAMTVEMVLGGHTAAGLATTVADNEIQAAVPAKEDTPEEKPAAQTQLATIAPQEVPVAAQEAAPDARSRPEERPPETVAAETPAQVAVIETPETQVADGLPPVTQSETGAAAVRPEPKQPKARTQPQATPAKTKARARRRIAAPTARTSAQQKRVAVTASNPASGIGRGRSDSAVNYNGRVAAHLARYKQYPADARSAGNQGVATVSFAIDGGGRVTSVRLARGSGIASIDREVQAMVRRASPFPAPPDGRGRSFTVPVRFNLR